MQNQKKQSLSTAGMRMAAFFLMLFCLAAFFIPVKALFTGEGHLAKSVLLPSVIKMYIEIAILAVLIFGGMCIFKRGELRLYWLLAIALVFAWIHVIFLPMLISAAYLASLIMIGCFLRKHVFLRENFSRRNLFRKNLFGRSKKSSADEKVPNCVDRSETIGYFLFYMNFLFGSAFAITLYCILSAFGIGKISLMRVIIYVCGVSALIYDFSHIIGKFAGWKQKLSWMLDGRKIVSVHEICREDILKDVQKDVRTDDERDRYFVVSGRVRFAWMMATGFGVLMFLIQAGRLNIALDFDTLWYGVRSEYIVAGGSGLYENPGLVGMVYVYSKGFEVLTLPLCDLASHSYLTFFNIWMAALGIGATIWNAKLLTEDITRSDKFSVTRQGKTLSFKASLPSVMAVVLTVAVPGIMNMTVTAKADLITWLLQLIMLGCFFQYIHVYENDSAGTADSWIFLAGMVGSYILSLTMKPTSLVFSTAVFGMMGLYLLWSWLRDQSALSDLFHGIHRIFIAICLPFAALIGIWARTMLITGMPVTSVFTSIFAMFGFKMKYPFATTELPQNYQEESTIHVIIRRIWQMLMQPQGEDMGHVVIAWGTSLMAVLIVLLIIYGMFSVSSGHQNTFKIRNMHIVTAFKVIFVPFVIVCIVSLSMLYQIDGNYFELLYSMLILAAIRAMVYFEKVGFYRTVWSCIVPLLLLNLFITSVSNWAWASGFSEIHILNKGRMNHRALEQIRMENNGNVLIWQVLSQNPTTRVISFGTHPYCLQFPCNVESYNDITSPWGNVEIVNTPEAFEEYMVYAKTEYVYAEAGSMGEGKNEWRVYLLRELISRGSLKDLFFENGNMLARVSDEKLSEEEAQQNLERFDREYIFYTGGNE